MSTLGGRHLAALKRTGLPGRRRDGYQAQPAGPGHRAVPGGGRAAGRPADLARPAGRDRAGGHRARTTAAGPPTRRGHADLRRRPRRDTLPARSDHAGGVPLSETVREIDINDGPRLTLTGVHRLCTELLARVGAPRATCARSASACRAGGGRDGHVIRPPIMQGWDGYRIPGFFADLSSAAVLVDNDVNMMALGEYSHRRDTKHLLYIKVGTESVVASSPRHLHRGASGAAGDIGHIRLPGHEDVLCHCGNSGCVEAVASGAAIAKACARRACRPPRT